MIQVDKYDTSALNIVIKKCIVCSLCTRTNFSLACVEAQYGISFERVLLKKVIVRFLFPRMELFPEVHCMKSWIFSSQSSH